MLFLMMAAINHLERKELKTMLRELAVISLI
jgi:hypothetical protein